MQVLVVSASQITKAHYTSSQSLLEPQLLASAEDLPLNIYQSFSKRRSLTRSLIATLLIWTSVSSSLLFSSQPREELGLSYSCSFTADTGD